MSQKVTIDEKMATLDALVAWFDSEDFGLERALEVYKQAEALATEIETELAGYSNEIIILKKKFDQATS
jgi:exodeoxyribonuclease VII small subunit